jgi:tRNA(fMet)-specific endonuclease VapC
MKGYRNIKEKMENVILNGGDIYNNAISYYEIKRGLLAVDAKSRLEKFNIFCEKFPIILFDDITIFDNASDVHAYLKKKGIVKNDADILIASIAKHHNMTLVPIPLKANSSSGDDEHLKDHSEAEC